ncbi:MAG TPA: RHS repeat-associated core domain-containing protein [Thermoanaerobaculia bacterium]|nr:RHS repeat-associated core domain-containing protein [Thermoanaerobaculia bacterium]
MLIIAAGQAVAAPAGPQQYIVKTKHLVMPPHTKAALSVQDVVRAAGGHVDYEWRDRLVVTLSDSAVQALVQHPAVEFVQKVVSGASDPATATASSAEPVVNSAALRPVPKSLPPWTSGTYSYDGQGNITAIGSNVYSYDAFSRLVTSTTNGIPETYTYDRYGNLTQKVTGTGSTALTVQGGVDDGNHLSAHCYDKAGNLTDDDPVHCPTATETYSFDALNRMTVKWNHTTHTQEYYIYNANDERIAVIPCSETACTEQITFSFRDESGKVLRQFEVPYQQFDSPWTWVEDYVYRDGVLLAAERMPAQGGRRYFHTDHLGTPRLVTDSNGRRISEHDYFPFGVEATPLRQDTLPVNGFNREEPMKFTGHERDFTGGTSFENSNYIDYMHARSTIPQWGRFLSVDPTWDSADIGHPQSWNRYSYVRNNPMGNTDPDGKICIPCAAVGALAAVSYESYRQVRSGEPVNNHRLLAAVGIGAVAGATLGAAVEAAPVVYNAALANPGTVATGTALAADLLSPPGGSGLPVVASEETFRQAVVAGSEKLAGFSIDGTKGLVGATFNRNILGLTADVKGGSSIAGLFSALEAEAKAAGATKLSIVGHAIINGKLLSPEIAKRFGYQFNEINKDTIQLMKVIP